ncbi:MAG TPA: MBL fold metallo-hydrolase [Steroidobacteraceae bacterium]|jgi:ribonuclease BN (tRNA processing enzyme)
MVSKGFFLNAVALMTCWASPSPAHECRGSGVELQVLGSGGPELEDRRASSSYLLWRDHRPVVLLDSGGGSALNFGRAGARVEDLAVLLLSHLHVDHTADLPALLKSSYFESRHAALPLFGPGGNDSFPSTTEFVQDLFGPRGAYRYLHEFLSGREDGYRLEAHDVELKPHEIKMVYSAEGLKVSATEVIHGHVPALAWRVDLQGRGFVFSGDTNGENGNLERLAKGADIFVAHNAIPETAVGGLRQLHMPPSVIGRIANEAGVKHLVLSHRMLRTLGEEASTLEAIRASFRGAADFADDLDCF